MSRKHYWKHYQSGDVYAVDLAGLSNDVLAAAGPVPLRSQTAENLLNLDMDLDPSGCAWLESESASGHMVELGPPYPGDEL